jgi:hypothetical protein
MIQVEVNKTKKALNKNNQFLLLVSTIILDKLLYVTR